MTELSARFIDVLSLGEALVDFLPSRRGALAEVPSFERHPGGAPANVAIGLGRLGARCAFVGAVGDDPFGAYLIAALTAEGVDATRVVRAPFTRTGLAFVSLDDAGKPRFFAAGAGSAAELALAPAHLETVVFGDIRVLHVSTGLVRSPGARDATFEAVRRAKEAGCVVALDPNLRLHHWRDTNPLTKDVEALVGQADVVKLSSDEIAFVCGTSDPIVAARTLVARGVRLAIVTCGEAGCVWARAGDGGSLPTRAAKLVDTTGAGDGFQAALLAGLSRRMAAFEDPFGIERARLENLLRLALEAGTRVCEAMGAVAGLARAEELGSLDV